MALKIFLITFFIFLLGVFNSYAEENTSNNINLPSDKVEFKTNTEPQNSASPAQQNQPTEGSSEQQPPANPEAVAQEENEATDVVEENGSVESTELSEDEGDRDLRLKIKERIRTYKYDPVFRKDPFTPPKEVEEIVEIEEEEAIHPLEKVDIEELQLKAIIWSNDGVIPRALFETRDGKAYTVSKNDSIGNKKAIIARVDIDRVWYMRFSRDPITQQDRYTPDFLTIGKDKKTPSGELWYERY